MTPKERKAYFGHLWPDACLANEWEIKDEAQRRAVTAECMRLIRGPQTDSTSALGRDEITALFVYLRHLGDSGSLEKSADWVSCQEDYKTFNRARQADWHERALYGAGKNKLDRNRFGGRATAAGGPLETLDAGEVRKRHLTMATRHQKKERQQQREKGQTLASQPAASGAANVIPFPPRESGPESQSNTGDCTSNEPKGASMGVSAEHSERADRPFVASLSINGVPAKVNTRVNSAEKEDEEPF